MCGECSELGGYSYFPNNVRVASFQDTLTSLAEEETNSANAYQYHSIAEKFRDKARSK